jgi:hypothetical protein
MVLCESPYIGARKNALGVVGGVYIGEPNAMRGTARGGRGQSYGDVKSQPSGSPARARASGSVLR